MIRELPYPQPTKGYLLPRLFRSDGNLACYIAFVSEFKYSQGTGVIFSAYISRITSQEMSIHT